ncbi:hypothetical protein [Sulfurimonas sp.]|uniref:hypothetical protein n=1 Tax=Sulfurimonas sp. TaxID=2022749 RepID=UPI0025E0C43A|nr:hypothetical protein [Sulfurimonas sp.]
MKKINDILTKACENHENLNKKNIATIEATEFLDSYKIKIDGISATLSGIQALSLAQDISKLLSAKYLIANVAEVPNGTEQWLESLKHKKAS